jgi:hypothetical protein
MYYGRGTAFTVRGASVTVGNVVTGNAGSEASVTDALRDQLPDSGEYWWRDSVLDFTIPRGNVGASTIDLGSVTLVPTTSSGNITNTGTETAQVLEFVIPCIDESQLIPDRVLISDQGGRPASSDVTQRDLWMLDGIRSNIAAQVASKQPAIFPSTSALGNILSSNLEPNVLVVTDASGKFAASNVPAGVIEYIRSLTSSARGQLDGLQPVINGSASSVATSNLTPHAFVITDASGKLANSNVSSNVIEFIEGVRQDLQGSLDELQPALTGAIADIAQAPNFTSNVLLASSATGNVVQVANTPASILFYLDGLDSNLEHAMQSLQPVVTGGLRSITGSTLSPSEVVVGNADGNVAVADVDAAALTFVQTVGSNVDQRLANLQPVIAGAAASLLDVSLQADRVVVSAANGTIEVSNVPAYYVSYLQGLTENVATSLDNLQPRLTGAGIPYALAKTSNANVVLCSNTNGYMDETAYDIRLLHAFASVEGNIQQRADDSEPQITGAGLTFVESNAAPNVVLATSSAGFLANTPTAVETAWFLADVDADAGGVQERLDGLSQVITGAGATLVTNPIEGGSVVVTDAGGYLANANTRSSQLWWLDGLDGDVAASLSSKATTFSGAATAVLGSTLAPDRVIVSDAGGKLANSNVQSSALTYIANLAAPLQQLLDAVPAAANGAVSNIIIQTLAPTKILVSDESSNGNVSNSNVSSNRLWYLDGLTQDVTGSLQGFETTVAGAGSSIAYTTLPQNRFVLTQNGKLANSDVDTVVVPFITPLTSNFQTQLDAKQPLLASDSTITVNSVDAASFNGNISTQKALAEHFGTGYHGNLEPGTFAGCVLTNDLYANNITFSASDSIDCNGFRIFVRDTLDLREAGENCIRYNGNAAAGNIGGILSGNTLNTYGASASAAYSGSNGGSAGNVSVAMANISTNGGKGGNGAPGFANGRVSSLLTSFPAGFQTKYTDSLWRAATTSMGGGGGGAGGGGGSVVSQAYGGGGGAGGGALFIAARRIALPASSQITTKFIRATGGSGGDGQSATGSGIVAAGGGGGGGGGWITIITETVSGNALFSLDASGGNGGNGGPGTDQAANGSGASGGGAGAIVIHSLYDGAKVRWGSLQYGNFDAPLAVGGTPAGETGGVGGIAWSSLAGVSNKYTNMALGLSVSRKVCSGYQGPCFRGRNDAGTYQDIGFDTYGNLDTSALTTFASGGNVWIQVLYDQTGNDRHAVQPTLAAQPRIVTAGALQTLSGDSSIPAMVFDGSLNFMRVYGFEYSHLALYVACVFRFLAATASTTNTFLSHYEESLPTLGRAWSFGTCNAATTNFQWIATGNVFADNYVGNATTGYSTSTPYLSSLQIRSGNVTPRLNGTDAPVLLQNNTPFTWMAGGKGDLALGCRFNAANSHHLANVRISEVVMFDGPATPSAEVISAMEMQTKSYYSIG